MQKKLAKKFIHGEQLENEQNKSFLAWTLLLDLIYVPAK